MTTAAQIKELVNPLLARHKDLALVGRWLFVKPVFHFARAVLIGRTAYADEIEPQWAMIHVFQARRTFSLNWGEFLANRRSRRPGLWLMSQADIQEALIEAIEERALPKLRSVTSLEDYLAFVSSHTFRHKLFDCPDVRIIVDVARGDLTAARVLRDAHIDRWGDNPAYDEESRARYRRVRELCARLEADDRPGLAALLHEWEAITVRNLKIEKLWDPTPFPLELQGDGFAETDL